MNRKFDNAPFSGVLKTITTGLIGAALLTGASLASAAGPSSNVAWDKATRDLVDSGDAERGATLVGACANCHGTEGISADPNNPHLAGQLPHYTFKQMKDYKATKRGLTGAMGLMMVQLAGPLSDQDIADMAAFYASKPLPSGDGSVSEAPVLVSKGDGKRLIPACALCHGGSGQGNWVNVAALKGQNKNYLVETMKQYRSGKRGNDIYSRMRLIAKDLTDAEIEEIAAYYAAMD